MTRQERVKRYMEILKGRGNSTRNWNILDRLSDEELFDTAKIAECMDIIDKCDMRLENNSNKYPEDIMQYVRQRLGADQYDDSKDAEINGMSANAVFDHVCEWNGLIGYADTIRRWVEGIYKIDLD